jgi:hypothetical protein
VRSAGVTSSSRQPVSQSANETAREEEQFRQASRRTRGHTSIPRPAIRNRLRPTATVTSNCRRPPPRLPSSPPRLGFRRVSRPTHGRARVRLASAARLPAASRSPRRRRLFPRPGPRLPLWPPPPPPPSPPLPVARGDCRRELPVRAFPIGRRRRTRWRRNLLRGHRRARPVQGPVGSERGTHRIRAWSVQARMFQLGFFPSYFPVMITV